MNARAMREVLEAAGRQDLRCTADPLNPCNSGSPPPGRHWAGGRACPSCHLRAALAAVQRETPDECWMVAKTDRTCPECGEHADLDANDQCEVCWIGADVGRTVRALLAARLDEDWCNAIVEPALKNPVERTSISPASWDDEQTMVFTVKIRVP